MKSTVTKHFALSALLLMGLSTVTYAETAPTLPTSKQKIDDVKAKASNKVEVVEEIKIEAQASAQTSNPALKEGEACDFSDLEEAKGETMVELPMAKSIPCTDVDCKDLKPAQLHKDNYQILPTAKTIEGCSK